jgi:hypothetical protein
LGNSNATRVGLRPLAAALKASTTLQELDLSNNVFSLTDALILADAISDMEAISSLNLSQNALTAGKYISRTADPVEYPSNYETDMSGLIALADAIKDMRAISQFTFSGDFGNSKPVTMETSMVEADFGGKLLGVSGAIMLSAFLPKCT